MKRTTRKKTKGEVKELHFHNLEELNKWVKDQLMDIHLISIQKIEQPHGLKYIIFFAELST
jgi:hypothetical protein